MYEILHEFVKIVKIPNFSNDILKKKENIFFLNQNYDDRVFQIKLIIWLIAYTTYTCTMFYLNLGFQTQYACKCIQRLSAHVQYLLYNYNTTTILGGQANVK